jgi:hypothetical protein
VLAERTRREELAETEWRFGLRVALVIGLAQKGKPRKSAVFFFRVNGVVLILQKCANHYIVYLMVRRHTLLLSDYLKAPDVPSGTIPWRQENGLALDNRSYTFVILWLPGLVTSYTLGGFVHILLVLAIIVILIRVIQGRRPV